MDTFEKDMAKKQQALMKNINANIAFLGKELKRTNDILEKQGIAVLPGVVEDVEKGDTNETE